MKIFYYSNTLRDHLKTNHKNVGFVPTMGALHAGHMALVKEARAVCKQVLVSIFVNPLQFNNAADLKKYPRSLVSDLMMLEEAGVDMVFIPAATDIFPEGGLISEFGLGNLDTRFEGSHRPGHFKGVVGVLYNLFHLIHPGHVFFGLKDLQQCLVVEKLIASHFPEIAQHNCEIIREGSGLAMSSRNTLLSGQERLEAAEIYAQLMHLKDKLQDFVSEREISIRKLKAKGIETEYLGLVSLPDMDSLEAPVQGLKQALVFAGFLGNVRLIDNVQV